MNKKIFIVSHNKCGTTSLKQFLGGVGLKVANQSSAEKLFFAQLMDPRARFGPAAWRKYISKSQVFQDVPFSDSSLLPWLLNHYPEARYIHVSRPSDEWYLSLINHHINRRLGEVPSLNEDGSLKWTEDLEQVSSGLPYLGYPLHKLVQARYGTSRGDPYNRAVLCARHEFQQKQARILLSSRNSLLLNLDELRLRDSGQRVLKFLGIDGSDLLVPKNQGTYWEGFGP